MEFIKASVLPYAKRGEVFFATNVAAQAASVGLTSTYTGLVIGNPLGNTKNLHILGYSFGLSVAPAAVAAWGLLSGYSATTALTAGTPLAAGAINGLIGSATAATAVAKSATTLGATPLYHAIFGEFGPTTQLVSRGSWIDLKGIIVVPPGGFVGSAANAVITGFASIAWAELDI